MEGLKGAIKYHKQHNLTNTLEVAEMYINRIASDLDKLGVELPGRSPSQFLSPLYKSNAGPNTNRLLNQYLLKFNNLIGKEQAKIQENINESSLTNKLIQYGENLVEILGQDPEIVVQTIKDYTRIDISTKLQAKRSQEEKIEPKSTEIQENKKSLTKQKINNLRNKLAASIAAVKIAGTSFLSPNQFQARNYSVKNPIDPIHLQVQGSDR
ncbi:MAG: hypothetical protein HRT47_08210 [Candidatus Caenarcaniphilales bacterium]|nr:hypothetical protein [Candidatus Caenarcaniphilales bacterium]